MKAIWKLLQKNSNRWRKLAAAAGMILLLNGCGSGIPIVSETRNQIVYTKPQMMLIAATERNRYQQIYTDGVWDAVLEDGQTFDSYLKEQVRIFLESMKTMTLLAQEQQITLSSAEKDRINQLADRYYAGLTDEDLEYMGVTEDDVVTMYQEYCLANKTVSEMTKELDLEVSDSEAKVITVRQIQLTDRETAEDVYNRVAEEGSDFGAVAKEASENGAVERKIGRGEETQAVEAAVFNLAAGEISPIVEQDGMFYIFQCVSDYEADATRERKTQIYMERKNQAFQQIYAQFQSSHKVEISDSAWEEIQFQGGEGSTASDFFSLYQEEFGSQGY